MGETAVFVATAMAGGVVVAVVSVHPAMSANAISVKRSSCCPNFIPVILTLLGWEVEESHYCLTIVAVEAGARGGPSTKWQT